MCSACGCLQTETKEWCAPRNCDFQFQLHSFMHIATQTSSSKLLMVSEVRATGTSFDGRRTWIIAVAHRFSRNRRVFHDRTQSNTASPASPVVGQHGRLTISDSLPGAQLEVHFQASEGSNCLHRYLRRLRVHLPRRKDLDRYKFQST